VAKRLTAKGSGSALRAAGPKPVEFGAEQPFQALGAQSVGIEQAVHAQPVDQGEQPFGDVVEILPRGDLSGLDDLLATLPLTSSPV
jgi:hypothetical protein